MRIIAGEWRGRPLAAPDGRDTRPTSDRAREGLFSMLASRIGSFEGLRIADLFAGSGALGLEALSRGAASCLFVDSDARAAAAIRRNLEMLGAENRSEIRIQALESLPPPRSPFDLILLDPPYRSGLAQPAVAQISDPTWLTPGGLVSVETDGIPIALPSGLALMAERRFGKAHILLARREG